MAEIPQIHPQSLALGITMSGLSGLELRPYTVVTHPIFKGPPFQFFYSPGMSGCTQCGLKDCDHSFYYDEHYFLKFCEACEKHGDHWAIECLEVSSIPTEFKIKSKKRQAEYVKMTQALIASRYKDEQIHKRRMELHPDTHRPLFDGPRPLRLAYNYFFACKMCRQRECDHSFKDHEGNLILKRCNVCSTLGDHLSWDCPVAAAERKKLRESKRAAKKLRQEGATFKKKKSKRFSIKGEVPKQMVG